MNSFIVTSLLALVAALVLAWREGDDRAAGASWSAPCCSSMPAVGSARASR